MNVRKLQAELRRKYPSAVLVITNFYGDVIVDKIAVLEKCQGIGSKIMQEICEFADKNKTYIYLCPTDNFGSNIDRLVNFYNRFGFIFSDGDTMYRKPLINK